MAEAFKPINGGGLQLYPFNAHKRWIVTDVNYRDDLYQHSIVKGISPLYREKVPLSQSLGNSIVADDTQLDNTNSNTTSNLAKKEPVEKFLSCITLPNLIKTEPSSFSVISPSGPI